VVFLLWWYSGLKVQPICPIYMLCYTLTTFNVHFTNPQIAMSLFREHRVMRSYTSWKYETSQFKNSHDYLFGLILDHLIMRIEHRLADEVARHATRWLGQRHKDEWPKSCSHVQAKSSILVVVVSYLLRKPPSSLWWRVLTVDDRWIGSFSVLWWPSGSRHILGNLTLHDCNEA
jgi:hypothetical protein